MKFTDLCGPLGSSNDTPWLDRNLTADMAKWKSDGVLDLKSFLPDKLIDGYRSVRDKVNEPGGWRHPTPYMEHKEILDICLYPPLAKIMSELIGHPMGLHLNLTGYVSTERRWHQDDYLNPTHVNGNYMSVWMALDDIDPSSGPFQYVRGSHTWPRMTREAIFNNAPKDMLDEHRWPSLTQDLVGDACEQEINQRNAQVTSYLPKKGDVLLWHARLMHQGSKPSVPGTPRLALIAHYSSIQHRPDMPPPVPYSGGYYFPITTLNKGTTK